MSGGRRAGTGRTPFALRPALRLGRRLAFAKAGRAALIIALIGIPTAGFAAVAVVVQSTQATTAERLDYDLGHASAQMRVSGPDLPGMVQDPVQWEFTDSKRNSPVTESDDDSPFTNVLAHVPDGALSIPVGSTPVVVQGAHGPVGLTAVEGSVWDPSLEGHWHVLDGSAPTTRSGLMVTPATLERLGARIGDTVDLTDPVTKRFTITGTMTDLGTDPGSQGVFLPWGTTLSTTDTTDDVGLTDVTVYLPSDAPTWSEIRQLNAHGIIVQSRPVVLDPPDARLPGGQMRLDTRLVPRGDGVARRLRDVRGRPARRGRVPGRHPCGHPLVRHRHERRRRQAVRPHDRRRVGPGARGSSARSSGSPPAPGSACSRSG